MAKRVLRIVTRRSLLAMAQTRGVADALAEKFPDVSFELLPVVTAGDRSAGSTAALGGKGIFTAELEAALRNGEAALAVHSAKDMPAEMADDFTIAAFPPREDARDALVSPRGFSPAELPQGASVGTGSLRRRVQLLAARPDLHVVPIRGNVDTRMSRALAPAGEDQRLDAVVLAMAGLHRTHLSFRHEDAIFPLGLEQCIPAAGQAALAIQTLADEAETIALVRTLDDADTRLAVTAERTLVHSLGASCQSCLGVHIRRDGSHWRGHVVAARPDGSGMQTFHVAATSAGKAGEVLLAHMRSSGATEYFR